MQLYKQTLELRKRILGEEHPGTLRAMNNLVVSYTNLGRHQETVQLGKQAVEARRHVLGPDHYDTIYSEQQLAMFSQDK